MTPPAAYRGAAPSPAPAAAALAALVAERAVLVCAGAGGVGKTSTAAALALHAAHEGRRAVVVTIDPARRLADALGLDGLTDEPHRIDGPWPGELHAAMLDTKATFDGLIGRYAAGPEQAARIAGNRFYRNISNALSGTQEYMAAEKLYELHVGRRFELIVVDTPPTRQALDFLDAPDQLARFLDHRVYKLMTSSGQGVTGVLNRAGVAVLRTASRLVGTSVMDDATAFFTAFEGLEAGFRQRSQDVRALLTSDRSAFLVVSSPQTDAVTEAAFFLRRLTTEGLTVGALVVNRSTPRFTDRPAAALRALSEQASSDAADAALTASLAHLATMAELADEEAGAVERLAAAAAGAPIARVPLLARDVHDLEGLDALRAALFAG